MEKEIKYMSLAELQAKMNRIPTLVEIANIKRNTEVLETKHGAITIKDGLNFMLSLRKEADRQKAMKACEKFDLQARKIQNVPYVPHEAMETHLAETFEITEEFDDNDFEITEDDE